MTRRLNTDRAGDNIQIAMVGAIVVVQAIAATFFIADASIDLFSGDRGLHIVAEVVIAVALTLGVGLGAWQARRMIEQANRDAAALSVARGAVAEIASSRFAQWGLTQAESEVALFALKGCDTAEIAMLRETAEGTVRAQLSSIYDKAGVSSRHALSSLFLEDLIDSAVASEFPD